ncbi:MAG: hypothetical protein GWP91_23540 [Rhodobacterales bacterium]|nr:hypothetical protein [Rhodobacterales bacterium]
MDEIALNLRRERAVSALLPLFFVSGLTALIYQTLWARQLHLVFGTSTFAIATVLASFMAGLGIGGLLMGRYADTVTRPLKIYGLLEIGIGFYAVIFPLLVTLVSPIYLMAWRTLQPGPLTYGLIQFALVGSLLILPTALMGSTLPLLARFATDRLGAAGDRVGTLYAVNPAGAVFGTWFAGFILLPVSGLWVATLLAALANVVLGIAAMALDSYASTAEVPPVQDDVDHTYLGEIESTLVPVAVCMALAGFAALSYEVAWTRLMALMLGASVYAFSVMLLAFLIGIAIGGKLGGLLGDQVFRREGQTGVLKTLAIVEVGVAVTSYGLMYLYPELPFWYVWLFDFLAAEEAPARMWSASLVLSGLIMTPPAVLMGIAFPLSVRAVVGERGALGGPVGTLYGVNTLGGVVGAFLTGFVLLPMVQVQGTIFVAALANLVAAAVVGLHAYKDSEARWVKMAPIGILGFALLFAAQRPPWNPLLMTAGMYQYVTHFENHTRKGIRSYAVEKYDLLFYEEGLSSVVTVARNQNSQNIWLANNGKVDASTTTDMPTQVLCSLLPMQYVDDPKDVLVIGLASGVTAGAITLIEDVDRLDIVELEPAIERAARLFDEHNHHVLDDPRVTLIGNDGRNHILLTAAETYDVIVSEPSNPWITGVSNLFTRELFELGNSRLKPGGVWSQWVQMYGMDSYDLRTLLVTFADVYPYVLVYATIEDADLVLVGSESPIAPNFAGAEHLLSWDKAAAELALVDVEEPLDLVALFQLGREQIVEMSEDMPRNTDDNMRIEYSAPRNLHAQTHEENFTLLLRNAIVPFDSIERDPLLLADLARNYQARKDVRAMKTIVEAIKLLPNDSGLRSDLIGEAAEWQQTLVAEFEETRDDDSEE